MQFVCFETTIGQSEFMPMWEKLLSDMHNKKAVRGILNKATAKTKFSYVSKHYWPQDDFQFSFKKERHRAERFPESRVRVVQAGGYIPLKAEYKLQDDEEIFKVVVFCTKPDADISLFTDVQPCQHVNVYQAYYESSTYAYIFEYFVAEEDAVVLQRQLKEQFPDIDSVIYRACMVQVV